MLGVGRFAVECKPFRTERWTIMTDSKEISRNNPSKIVKRVEL